MEDGGLEFSAGADERDRAEAGEGVAQVGLRTDEDGLQLVDGLGAGLNRLSSRVRPWPFGRCPFSLTVLKRSVVLWVKEATK